MATLLVRLSGSEQATENVEGIAVGAFFVHHPIYPSNSYVAKSWTVSHSRSGQNLAAYFNRRVDAVAFAGDMNATYDGNVDAKELVEQFRNRGDKPSVVQLAERHNMCPW
jgi:hypothetical protein